MYTPLGFFFVFVFKKNVYKLYTFDGRYMDKLFSTFIKASIVTLQ